MRISLLLKRESFPEVLEKTLAQFFSDIYGKTFKVKWSEKWNTNNTDTNCQKWLCNFYLNSIFVSGVASRVVDPVLGEFSRSVSVWKTPLNKIYAALGIRFFFARFLAGAYLEITPALPDAKNKLILGGNHHIRLLDAIDNSCCVIEKYGFDSSLMMEELKVRRKFLFLPTPKITQIGENGKWYKEEFIIGTPINRLSNISLAESAVEQVSQALFRLYEETWEEEDACGYVTSLCADIQSRLLVYHLLNIEEKNAILHTCNFLKKIIFCQNEQQKEIIITVQCHGDFQSANILCGDDDEHWLIDWEYTGRRQIAYDGLVYCLQSRNSGGLSKRIRHAIDGGGDCQLMFDWPRLYWDKESERKRYLALFLLEEALLKIRENDNVHFKCLGHGFKSFFGEVDKSLISL